MPPIYATTPLPNSVENLCHAPLLRTARLARTRQRTSPAARQTARLLPADRADQSLRSHCVYQRFQALAFGPPLLVRLLLLWWRRWLRRRAKRFRRAGLSLRTIEYVLIRFRIAASAIVRECIAYDLGTLFAVLHRSFILSIFCP